MLVTKEHRSRIIKIFANTFWIFPKGIQLYFVLRFFLSACLSYGKLVVIQKSRNPREERAKTKGIYEKFGVFLTDCGYPLFELVKKVRPFRQFYRVRTTGTSRVPRHADAYLRHSFFIVFLSRLSNIVFVTN